MPSMATNYFIDYVGGSDTANGTSTSTPFQHCPGDIAATSIALATTLVGGDTVIFKGGVSYILTAPFIIGVATPGITLKFAGANGSPITYDGNSAGTFGVGMANFTDNFSTNHIDAFCSLVGITNLVFKDLFIGPMGGGIIPSDPSCTLYSPNGLPPNKAGGITSYGFASNVVLGSCIISNLGYNGNGCPLGGGSFDANAGFHSSGCNGVTITNCQFMLMKDGIYFDNNSISANIIVSNCTFGVMSEWVLNLIHHTNCYCSNVFICNNLFTNTDQGIVGSAWSGYNAGALPHRNILFMRGDENAGVYALDRNVHDTNVNIFNNNMVDTLGYLGGSAGLWFQENSSALVYNNIFNNLQHSSGALIYSEPASNTVSYTAFFNNTFYTQDGLKSVGYAAAPNKNGFGSYNWGVNVTNILLESYNNLIILYKNGNENNSFCEEIDCENTALATNVVVDYSIYRGFQSNFPGTNMVYGNWPATSTGPGFGYVQTNTGPSVGWDIHSRVDDPLIIATNDFHLASNSYALNAGSNLTSRGITFLNSDYDGNQRVASGNWAVGAFGAGTTNIPPITNFIGLGRLRIRTQ